MCIKINFLNILKLILIQGITIGISTNTFALDFKPGLGVDIGNRNMKFQDLYGKGHFAKNYYHISPYIQAQLSEYLDIQAGLEYSDTRKVLKQYAESELVLGNAGYTTVTDTNTFNSSRIKGEFIQMNINSNILSNKYNLPIKISIFMGISMLKLYSSFINVTLADLTAGRFPLNSVIMKMNSSKKVIPKFGLQLKYNLTKDQMLSFNLGYFWQKTSLIFLTTMDYRNHHVTSYQPFSIKPKNSTLLTAGFSYFIV